MKILFFLLLPVFTFGQQQFFIQNQAAPNTGFPVAIYSVRLVNTSYSGYCMKVRRSSDNTEQNIGFVSGTVDTASMKIFVGAGSGYVSVWYDQSTLGNDATQTTLTAQPTIITSGAVNMENGKPTLTFNGTSMYLTVVNKPLTGIKYIAFLSVANFKTANNNENLFVQSDGGGTTGRFEVRRWGTANALVYLSNNVIYTGTASINSSQKLIELYGFNAGNVYSYVNTVADGSIASTGTTTFAAYNCYIGWRNSSYYFGGTIQEIQVYNGDGYYSTRSTLETEINSYYSIY